MWRDNATWGEDMICGELAKLGYRVSPRTVAKYRPSGLARGRGQRWSTFIGNHLQETWARDYFTIVTARFRVLYVFVVLSLRRRRLVHVGSAQRLVEAVADSDEVPRFLVIIGPKCPCVSYPRASPSCPEIGSSPIKPHCGGSS